MPLADLPITPLLPRLRASLAAHTRLVLEAPPGAGKTTQVPPALLAEPWLQGRQIIVLEPRRLAARAAAEFMAAQRGEAVGQAVGYRIRFESRVSAATRILVVTEGILTRMLQDDPELPDIGAIVFDEFHERHLAGDLGAALALDVQASLRPDLRLLVMSATLDDPRIAGDESGSPWFDAPVLRSEGRAYPVRIEYPAARANETADANLRRAVQQALAETTGDVLVFLPGRREIAQAQRMLQASLATHAADATLIQFLPLHGELALAEQQAALVPSDAGVRRVILATNVAESSITVPSVRAVIDGGYAREPRFDPNSGLTRLATVRISQASADQRAGRAGRLAPGMALRLWPASQRLAASRTPEIAQLELSSLALELAAWGIGFDVTHLHWLDPPPAGALAQARGLLQALGALDESLRITPCGRALLALGTDPRLAAAAIAAPTPLRHLASDLLALLESRSPLRGAFNDDLRTRLAALHAWRDGGARAAAYADAGALAAIETLARHWRQRLGLRHGASGSPDALAAGNLLLPAFPDRAAQQDPNDARRYRLANGRGVRLHEESTLFGEPWLVVAEARFDARDSLVQLAAPFDPALLQHSYPTRIVRERVVRQNAAGTVEACEETRFDALLLARRALPASADDALPALLASLRANGLAALPWTAFTQALRTRSIWLRGAMPELDLPDLGDTALLGSLESWLAPALHGKRKLDALSATALDAAFAGLIDYRQRKTLDELAPATITVPSGLARSIDYAAAIDESNVAAGADTTTHAPRRSPVLAVKLQEMFGLAETPRIAGGRVPLTLHLLSPGGRPIQVTQDLRGFWDRTYPEVKKELQGRYPKHPWPADPWSASPTHRAKRRS